MVVIANLVDERHVFALARAVAPHQVVVGEEFHDAGNGAGRVATRRTRSAHAVHAEENHT